MKMNRILQLFYSFFMWCSAFWSSWVLWCSDSLPPPPGWHYIYATAAPRMSPTPRSAKYGATHSCHHLPGWRITSPSVIIAPPRSLRWKPHTSSHHRAAIGVPAGSTMVRRTSQTSRTGQTALQCNSAGGGESCLRVVQCGTR